MKRKKKSFISLAIFKLKNGFQHRRRKRLSSFSVSAEDEHGAKDWQEVRVLVDRPLDMKVLLNMDYNFWSDEENKLKSYAEIFASGESYVVSTEDPVFLSLQFPTESRIDESSVAEEIKFNYTNDGTESFELAWKRFG